MRANETSQTVSLLRGSFSGKRKTGLPDRGGAAWAFSVVIVLLVLSPAALGQTGTFRASQDVGGARSPGSWGDINDDGYADLLTGSNLYLNTDNGNGGRQLEVVREADSPVGGVFGDYDQDGRTDVFSFTSQRLFHNDGNGAFTLHDEGGDILPNLPMSDSRGASWSDYDNDGDLDLYVGGYENGFPGTSQPDVRLRNDGRDGFTTVYTQTDKHRARGITTSDYDSDGDGDIYVSNYRLQPNLLQRNDGDGAFTEVAASKGVDGNGGQGAYGHTIGSAWGDFNNDGRQDLFVGNFAHDPDYQDRSRFYKNLGEGENFEFELMNKLEGADYQESYASPALADYDNDGDLDLFLTTVYNGDHPRLYRNEGDFNFTNVTEEEGLDGLSNNPYQASWADFDRDGDMDLVTNGTLFENDASGNGNHWLQLALEGDGQEVNTDAIGAQVKITLDAGTQEEQTLLREVIAGMGEGNQNQRALHFGLGDHEGPVDLEILWPGGDTKTIEGINPDQFLGVTFGEAGVESLAAPEPGTVLLLGAGGLTLLTRRRRRKASRAC